MGDLCVAKISLCCMFVVPCHLCVSYLRLCACHCHWYEICVLSSGMHTNTEFRMAASHKFPQYCSYPLLYFINHILFSLSASVCVVIHWKVGGLCWWYQSWRERWSFSQNQRLLGRYWLTFQLLFFLWPRHPKMVLSCHVLCQQFIHGPVLCVINFRSLDILGWSGIQLRIESIILNGLLSKLKKTLLLTIF
jgi:hypothetical protein